MLCYCAHFLLPPLTKSSEEAAEITHSRPRCFCVHERPVLIPRLLQDGIHDLPVVSRGSRTLLSLSDFFPCPFDVKRAALDGAILQSHDATEQYSKSVAYWGSGPRLQSPHSSERPRKIARAQRHKQAQQAARSSQIRPTT